MTSVLPGSPPAPGPGAPTVRFDHLDHLTDDGGLHEHARGTDPRHEHGYCVDDVARGLLVAAREQAPDARVDRLRRQYLAFVVAAVAEDGGVHNRRGRDLAWHDEPSVEDCWGRALHGLGTVVGAAGVPEAERAQALAAFEVAARRRSPHARATAMAALGAAEVLRARPEHPRARAVLAGAAEGLAQRGPGAAAARWPWPEPRLRYANAVGPEVLVAAGHLLDRPDLLARGLDLLGWLLDLQTRDGHLSVVPVRGLGPDEESDPRDGDGPGADQQPIEVGVLADACARAHEATGEQRWADALRACAAWFRGDNDSATVMVDPVTGGGHDGLEPRGRNENQGAESTLAAMATLQHAARLPVPPVPPVPPVLPVAPEAAA